VNPAYLSAISTIITAVMPDYVRQSGTAPQCLRMSTRDGEILVVTTRDGIEMNLFGSAQEYAQQISAKTLNLEVLVAGAPDINGPADMVFVSRQAPCDTQALVLAYKCVYLPRSAPPLTTK
jgi:hypothetical protein